jgi:transposase
MITEQQYQRLMREYQKSGKVGEAAMKAGMHRQSARRYLGKKEGPKALRPAHTWRTRRDPLEAIWPAAQQWLEETPEVELKMLFEHLVALHPDLVDGRALRTFQRRGADWLRRHGPPKEVFFAQKHEPGQCMQTDWTNANELGVTVAGEAFAHLLCHSVLPYSNWEWAIPCLSESGLSLKAGLQASLWELGGVPRFSQTDQSSTATHQLKRGKSQRGFNAEYVQLCEHLGMTPRTIAVGNPNQNGDVEAAQGVLKRRLRNQLILRGSRDFDCLEDYCGFVADACRGANALRATRLAEECAHLGDLPTGRFPQTQESTVRVSSYCTVRVRGCAYSVPARLIGSYLQAHLSEQTVRLVYRGEQVASYPRSTGKVARIDYRHVIASLVRKPAALSRYIYREEMFPKTVFRQAYDRLEATDERNANAAYLKLLKLAADHGESRIGGLIGTVLRAGELPCAKRIAEQLDQPPMRPAIAMEVLTPTLDGYDELIREVAS